MPTRLRVEMRAQPDDSTCGPTCLHAVYAYHGDPVSLDQVVDEIPQLDDGGTLAVMLGCHALERGYRVSLYSMNLQVFDPTWFDGDGIDLAEKLREQARVKRGRKLRRATDAYLRFLDLGGRVELRELDEALLSDLLAGETPLVAGLSATWLYRVARERVEGGRTIHDDVGGAPTGHFVVVSGLDRGRRTVQVADPYQPNPFADHHYEVDVDRLVSAIRLGILTHDSNVLVVERVGGAPVR